MLFGVSTVALPIPFREEMFPIVPIQLLDALLLPILSTAFDKTDCNTDLALPSIHHHKGFTIVPSLNLKLSDQWSTILNSKDIMATDDLANINQSIWDQRTALLFPKNTVPILDWLRRKILCKHFHKIFLGFKTYLRLKYPEICEKCFSERNYQKIASPASFNRGGS